jgi:tape measure domain-containing protein
MPGVNYEVNLKAGGFTSGINQALSGVGALGGKLLGLVGIAGSVAAALAGVKKAVGGAAALETTTIAFETLLGSAAKAKSLLGELKQLGASTPLEFPELADASRKLIAFGVGADTVTATLRRIGDVATGIQAPIGEIAEIYGKARVQGTLFAEDINQLTGRGIPVIQEFAKILGVSEGEVKKLASEGKITFGLLERAFVNLTDKGGKFAGMMGRQAETTAGLWSTLKDSINEVFTTLGEPINDAIKPLLKAAIELTERLGEAAKRFAFTLKAAIEEGNVFEVLGAYIMLPLKRGANAISALLSGMGAGLSALFGGLFDELKKLPEFLFVAGKNLVAGAQLLLKPEFWKGVELMFVSVGLRFAAAVGNALIPVVEKILNVVNSVRVTLGKDPISGAGLRAGVQTADILARGAQGDAIIAFTKAVTGFKMEKGPELNSPQQVVQTAFDAFWDAFIGSSERYDTTGERELIRKAEAAGAILQKESSKQDKAAEKQGRAADRQTIAADHINRAAKLMERLFGAPEEGSGRIRTFNRAETATRRFLRRSKADQDGSLSDFLGPIDADLKRSVGRNLNLARLYRETQRDDKSGRAQEKLLSRIDHNTRETAQQLAKFQPA